VDKKNVHRSYFPQPAKVESIHQGCDYREESTPNIFYIATLLEVDLQEEHRRVPFWWPNQHLHCLPLVQALREIPNVYLTLDLQVIN
jgi:hypothetical protein